jgi:hypothetical protein
MLNRGRDFLLSPAWGDAEPSALFDRNSGDYWIITELARHLIVELSESSVACSRDALFRHAQTAFPDEVEADMIEAVVDELLRLDILQHQSA